MNKKFGIKEVVAVGIGTAIFVALTAVQIPLFLIPNTYLQPRMAILAFFAAAFGPIVGGVIGVLGHALGDAIFYGSVWWSWVIPEAVVGAAIGFFAKQYAVKEGNFISTTNVLIFNGVQTAANAIAWIGIAPALDILIYAEPTNKVFIQGAFAFVGNIIIIAILGTILISAYSKISGKSSGLKLED
ncbi:ECF-type riboflavin transporter substrate-binding protein [Butyrivibrio sp. WCE2006]|uniref:ECF-type riboflavin transporter substrate-binding protein n=1 Tax=Butyrivibrio sp. WCE2006 TaxID=1410611 RepID=UPI0005D17BEF|nr:ECF-type riboflavin transporter substrate-binding protein [Butyrivibrio sp. WCE2006]